MTKVYEVTLVRETIIRTEDNQKIIYEQNDSGEWVYHAPNAQTHTVEYLEAILQKLKELNEVNECQKQVEE